ncbi:MAG TPA: glycosyltransferase family 2 protein [Methanobacteriaceae archaeon]|nr:glycosyltransferase family 2 protein [Methanobacteriaceae archaeon]
MDNTVQSEVQPIVTIIIINWNGWKDTIECLESLYQIEYPNYHVVVIDNASEDDSIEKIKEYCEGRLIIDTKFSSYQTDNKPLKVLEINADNICDSSNKSSFSNKSSLEKKIKEPSDPSLILLKNKKNYGFAQGNNIGIQFAMNKLNSDYLLLLNNDTIVDYKFLTELVEAAKSDPKMGFAGPKTYYYNFNGQHDVINFAGGMINLWKGHFRHTGINEVDHGQYDKVRKVDYAEGSCLLVRKDVVEKVGMLDPGYFAYLEESDWCIRGLNAGYISLFVPQSKIWHKISASSSNSIKIYYLTRNKFWFIKRYAKKSQLIVFLLYFFLFRFWYLTGACIIYREEFKSFFRGIVDGMKFQ